MKKSYLYGFSVEGGNYKYGINIFDRMEITDQLFKDVVEKPSKPDGAVYKNAGHIRNS